MKKFKLLSMFAIALLAVGTLFASCSSDDDGQEPNTITNNKGTYKVNDASITDFKTHQNERIWGGLVRSRPRTLRT